MDRPADEVDVSPRHSGRAAAGTPAPAAWKGIGGDAVTARPGTVYRSSRIPLGARRLLTKAGLVTIAGVLAVLIPLAVFIVKLVAF